MKKESRSQTRSTVARQQTSTRNAETESVLSTRKQSRKVTVSAPVTYGTPSKDTKSVSKSRSTDLLTSSGRSREIKQTDASNVASPDTVVSSATNLQQQEPDTALDSAQENVTSVRKGKTVSKTPDRNGLKSRRWVRGGPIEYSTPPSDHSSGNVADKQKCSSDSHDTKKGKSLAKKNIALAFESTDKEADVKQRYKDSDSVLSTTAGGKRKKDTVQQSLNADSKGLSVSKVTSRKTSKSSSAVKIEPETTRTKRMARLNAEAIVSLIYKHDEPIAGSSKFHYGSDSDINSDSSEFSSEEEHLPVAKKCRAKVSQSQEDLIRTFKTEGQRAGRRPGKKREMQSAEKESSRKSEKSPKSQSKVSSKVSAKSCKKKSVETISSSSWSPPKRMASLNAQVCFHTC